MLICKGQRYCDVNMRIEAENYLGSVVPWKLQAAKRPK